MITKADLQKCQTSVSPEVDRTYVIGVDSCPTQVNITLISFNEEFPEQSYLHDSWECSQESCLRDLPDLVRHKEVEMVAIDIGPERLFSEKLAEILPCDTLLVNYRGEGEKNLVDGILSVDRTEALEATFDVIKDQNIQMPNDCKKIFHNHWADQMTSMTRKWFYTRKTYTSDEPDFAIHSLTFALLAANEIKQRQEV